MDKTIPTKDKVVLKKFNKNKINHNTYVEKYEYIKNEESIGRVYSKLQGLPKEYRNALLGENAVEIDFENSHFIILSQIADKYELKNENINYYIQNREFCLSKIHQNRKEAKDLFLKTQYGGKVEGLEALSIECYNILSRMKTDNSLNYIYKYAEKRYKEKGQEWKSLDHSFLSLVLQTIENRQVIALYDSLKQNDVPMNMILHDAVIINGKDFDFVKSKQDMETHIFDETEYYAVLALKKCEQKYKISDKKFVVIESEKDACEYLHKNHKNDIKRGIDGFYVKNKDNKHYTKGEDGLRVLIKNIDFRKEAINGDCVLFSSTTRGMKNIIEYFVQNCNDLFPVDEKFIENVNAYTKERVYYTDKYYDLKEQKWCEIEDDKLPILYLDREAPNLDKITKEEIDTFKTTYLLDMLKPKQLDFILKSLGRAVGGNLDKNWTIISGLRNSGKGVLQTIVFGAFPEYCNNINLPMAKTQNTGDANQFRWILSTQSHFKRISFANETATLEGRKLKIDGNDIKKLVSGGDYIQARGLYKDEISVIFNSHLFACVNHIPESDPADAMMTCLPVKMPYKYVENPQDICEKQGNDKIKEEIVSGNNIDIFTKIVFNSYVNNELKIGSLDDDDKQVYQDCVMENATEAPYIFRTKLKKSPDTNELISFGELKHIFKPSGMNDIMLGRFLSARMDVKREWKKDEKGEPIKNEKGNKIYITCYKGYKVVNDDEE
jgi:hypothetical protein